MINIDSLVLTTPDIQKKIAKNFAKRRKEHKLTQRQISEFSGVPVPSIKKFEQSGEISLKSLVKLSRAMEYEDELLKLFTTPYYTNIEDMLNE
ncbi:MAG: helix-turn-helix domain-containing protein [Sphaerochaetaceae bacterium]|nr:helix-turn-helix domain-containing protein [Sphaerochaetaceae bacterium]